MIRLETNYVFIDTSVFIQCNFSFGSHKLAAFEKLVGRDVLLFLTNEVTEAEVRKHIDIAAHEDYSLIREFKKKSKFAKNYNKVNPMGIYDVGNPGQLSGVVISAYEKLLGLPSCISFAFNEINCKSIVDLYIGAQPPFSSRKKDEFPDAIVLTGLLNFCKQNRIKAYVISTDGDFENFCKRHDCLIYLNDFDKFIELVMRSFEENIDPIKHVEIAFEASMKEITSFIASKLSSESFDILDEDKDEHDGAEITLMSVDGLDIEKRVIANVLYSWVDYEIDVRIDFTVSIKYPDLNNSPWVDDDFGYAYIVWVNKIIECTGIYPATISLAFKSAFEDKLEILDFSFENYILGVDLKKSKVISVLTENH